MSGWFPCVLWNVPCLDTRRNQDEVQESFRGPERSSSHALSRKRSGSSPHIAPINPSVSIIPGNGLTSSLTDSLVTSFCLSLGVVQTWLKEVAFFSPFHSSNEDVFFWYLVSATILPGTVETTIMLTVMNPHIAGQWWGCPGWRPAHGWGTYSDFDGVMSTSNS